MLALRLADGTETPRNAILTAWLEVEKAAADVAESLGYGRVRASNTLFQRIEGSLMQEEQGLYQKLRHLRGQAVHDNEFTPSIDAVIDYVMLADRLAARLAKSAADNNAAKREADDRP